MENSTEPVNDVTAQDSAVEVQPTETSVMNVADSGTNPEPSIGSNQESLDESDLPDSIEAIEAAVDAERQRANLPTLDESSNVPAYNGPDLWGSIRERIEKGPNLTGWQFDATGFLGDLYGIGQSALYGLGQGAQETIRTGLDVGHSPLSPGGAGESMSRFMRSLIVENIFGKGSKQDVANQAYDQASLESEREIRESIPNLAEILGVPKPDTILENVVAAVTPFVASYFAGGKLLEGMGVASKLSSVQIPGILGQGLARVGVTGSGAGRTLLEMLKGAGAGFTVLPSDASNFADMLNGFKDRNDNLGSISRAWLNSVPGEKWLIHDEDDSPLLGRFKNSLDVAYGELLGPIVYLIARNARVGWMAAKGSLERGVLERAASEQQLVADVLEKLGKDSGNETAMGWLFGEEPVAGTGKGTETEPFVAKASASEPLPDAGLDESIPAVAKSEANAPPTQTDEAFNPLPTLSDEFKNLSPVEQVKRMLAWSPEETVTRIHNAQQIALDKERSLLADQRAFAKRYNTLTTQTGKQVERSMFDSDGYLEHLQSSVNDPEAFKKALGDWSSFMAVPETGPIPSLLTPKQASVWDGTPFSVTGNVIDTVKRLTTTNAARKNEAVRFLADMLGNGTLGEDRKFAKSLLESSGTAAGEIDTAARLMLTNRMYVTNSVIPDLHTAVSILGKMPDDIETQRMALDLIRTVNSFEEANRNIRGAFGRGLQSAKIDPQLEQSLREVYGPDQYRRFFNPTAAGEESVVEASVNAAADVPNLEPLSIGEKAQLDYLMQRWSVIDPSERPNFLNSLYRSGQHPVWKGFGQTANFGVDLMGNLTMSAMLFHPATWTRVFQGAMSAAVYDSVSQGLGATLLRAGTNARGIFKSGGKFYESVFHGAPLDEQSYKVMQFGGLWRLLSLPHSMLVGGKSFIRPKWQEVYGIGSTLYKSSPILGPEMLENSFGKDFATKVFTSAGGWPGRLLRTAGAGLGFPQHTLGSFETMINHGALSSRLAEELYSRALTQRVDDPLKYVFEHIPDIMEDAVVAKSVPRGNVALRNRAGFNVDDLRNLAEAAGENADYSSLRESGRETLSPLATTKLGDTVPFRLESAATKWISSTPYLGPMARATLLPFGRVTANMASRMVTPVQALMAITSRAVGMPGVPSRYIDEVLGGLHGPHKQAQLVGHMFLSGGLFLAGAANMYLLRNSGKDVSYPLGSDAQREASNERGVRYGESLLPDGSTVTTQGFNPFVNFYNEGNYASWIIQHYGIAPFLVSDPESKFTAAEAWKHVGQLGGESVPMAPMFQGLREVFGGIADAESGEGDSIQRAAAGLAGSIGNAFERPFRIPDLQPGAQVPGRSTMIRDDGINRAFLTGAAGFSGDPNMDRINAYDMAGAKMHDKYDPVKGIDAFLEAFGLPSKRPYDDSPLGRYLGELESHGIAFPAQNPKQQLRIGGNIETVPINLQHFYNPKTKEHLWDVYNRLLSEQRVTGAWIKPGDTRDLSLKQALNGLAKELMREGESGSRVARVDSYRLRTLSPGADKMQVLMEVMRDNARSALETYLIDHADEFVDSDGRTLPSYAKLMNTAKKPPTFSQSGNVNAIPPTEPDSEPSVETAE